MRKSKERKHELQRIRTANKIAKKDKQKNRIADNVVMHKEMGDNYQIVKDIVYTFIPRRALIL
jgi:hypothetical protein|tara:strand:+ start:1126 stop:1314 length:189 start_codon:yes stop_codon:yes gene_type:complete